MKIGDLVRIDPLCPIYLDLKIDDPDEYEKQLKWLGVIVGIMPPRKGEGVLYRVQWGHMSHPTPEYGDYLEVLCE
jgi:hypothetical protein